MSTDNIFHPDGAVQAFLERTLPHRGSDEATAASNLWKHKNISDRIRDHAINMSGKDVYAKVKPPGDTRLFMHQQWNLVGLVDHNNQVQIQPQKVRPAISPANITQALRVIPTPPPDVKYTLTEEDKGQLAGPPPAMGVAAHSKQ